jgi:hypothetical protein
MRGRIDRENCPKCQEAHPLPIDLRRHAEMQWRAKLLLAVGIALTIVALLASLYYSILLGEHFTQGMKLHREEKGMLYYLAYLVVGVPLSLLPAFLGWRWCFALPRLISVTCPSCGWSGVCRVWEGKAVAPPSQYSVSVEMEIQGIPVPESPLDKKRDRLEQRRKKQQREGRTEEAKHNPEFDFS